MKSDRFSFINADQKINIENYKIISTINGTIGVEALEKSIPVTCHNSAYYYNLGGVIDLEDGRIYRSSDLANLKIGTLMTNLLYDGLTDPYLISEYGEDKLIVGWQNMFKKVLDEVN